MTNNVNPNNNVRARPTHLLGGLAVLILRRMTDNLLLRLNRLNLRNVNPVTVTHHFHHRGLIRRIVRNYGRHPLNLGVHNTSTTYSLGHRIL